MGFRKLVYGSCVGGIWIVRVGDRVYWDVSEVSIHRLRCLFGLADSTGRSYKFVRGVQAFRCWWPMSVWF